MTEDFILNMLADIESRKLQLTANKQIYKGFHGDITYTVSNDYKIVIFIDGNSFDYVSEVISPKGDVLDIWDKNICQNYNLLQEYVPLKQHQKEVYKIFR